MSKMTTHGRWEDMARERTGKPPSCAEVKKMKSLMLYSACKWLPRGLHFSSEHLCSCSILEEFRAIFLKTAINANKETYQCPNLNVDWPMKRPLTIYQTTILRVLTLTVYLNPSWINSTAVECFKEFAGKTWPLNKAETQCLLINSKRPSKYVIVSGCIGC